jgi:hypothetical protein
VRAFGAVPAPGLQAAASPTAIATRPSGPRSVLPASLPYGDCQNLDEYARFQAMPRISRAERETVDWDGVIEDLLDD